MREQRSGLDAADAGNCVITETWEEVRAENHLETRFTALPTYLYLS